MISLDKEQKILTLLKANLPDREIARLTDVPRGTIASVRKNMELVDGVSKNMLEKTKRLLMIGTSFPSIMAQTKLPKATLYAIRRHRHLQPRSVDEQRDCPTCGATMFPKNKVEPTSGVIVVEPNISRSRLEKIVMDIIELSRLQLIGNPLFCNIAQQAESILEKPNGKTSA